MLSLQAHIVLPEDSSTFDFTLLQDFAYGMASLLYTIAMVMCLFFVIWLTAKTFFFVDKICARRRIIALPKTDHTAQNQREVVGWRFATEQELRNLPPLELQELLDERNPFWILIDEQKMLIEKYQNSRTPWAQARHRIHVKALQLLREQPEAVEHRVLAPQSNASILATAKAIQSVRKLPKG